MKCLKIKHSSRFGVADDDGFACFVSFLFSRKWFGRLRECESMDACGFFGVVVVYECATQKWMNVYEEKRQNI